MSSNLRRKWETTLDTARRGSTGDGQAAPPSFSLRPALAGASRHHFHYVSAHCPSALQIVEDVKRLNREVSVQTFHKELDK